MANADTLVKAHSRALLASRVQTYPAAAVKLRARLQDLLHSAPPMSADHGICNDILRFSDASWVEGEMLILTMRALKATAVDPLGDVFLVGNKWAGTRGERRRKFAGKLADLIGEML